MVRFTASSRARAALLSPASIRFTAARLKSPLKVRFATWDIAPLSIRLSPNYRVSVSYTHLDVYKRQVSASTVTLVESGNCSIEATQAGNSDYAAATSVKRTFAVSKESQTITFGVLSSQTYGASPFTVSATASSGLPVSYTHLAPSHP